MGARTFIVGADTMIVSFGSLYVVTRLCQSGPFF